MQNKYVKIILFFISLFMLILFILSLVKDINFFINKTESIGQILSIEDLGVQKNYRVNFKYFNEKKNKEMFCRIDLKKNYGYDLKKAHNPYIKIYYASNFPETIYFADYGTPRQSILIFDVALIFLMTITLFANKWW